MGGRLCNDKRVGDLWFIRTTPWISKEVKPRGLRPGKGVTDGLTRGLAGQGAFPAGGGIFGKSRELTAGLCSPARLHVAKAAHGITGLAIQVEILYWETSKCKQDSSIINCENQYIQLGLIGISDAFAYFSLF